MLSDDVLNALLEAHQPHRYRGVYDRMSNVANRNESNSDVSHRALWMVSVEICPLHIVLLVLLLHKTSRDRMMMVSKRVFHGTVFVFSYIFFAFRDVVRRGLGIFF